jgi:hypothetical protein
MKLWQAIIGATGVATVAAVTASAQMSVTPKSGTYRTLGGGEGGGYFKVVGGAIASGGAAQSNFHCNRINAFVAKKIPIVGGSFTYTGPLKAEPGVTITWTGKWTSPTTVSGTVVLKTATCNSGVIHWKARLSP